MLGAGEIMAAVRDNQMEEYVPFTGQVVGLIHAVRPAGRILQVLVQDADEILHRRPR